MSASSTRRVLIVYAHYINTSFNAALLDAAVTTLKDQGCDVTVSDLYAKKFNPVIGPSDIKGESPEPFRYTRATAIACKEGRLVDDIIAEQENLRNADLVIFQFPLQWSSLPAILKGWFERVFTGNFAFQLNQFGAPMGYDEANFVGKKAMLSITTDGPPGMYSPEGRHGDIDVMLFPIQSCLLKANGFSVLHPQLNFAVNAVGKTKRKEYLENWKKRLGSVWEETPLHQIPNSEFENQILKADSRYRTCEIAPSIGTHLHKPFKK